MVHSPTQISYNESLQQNDEPYPYKGILICLLILKYIWEQYINWRQIRKHLISQIPPELEQFKIQNKSFLFQQSYHFEKMAFQMLYLSISAAVDLLMIMCNIYPFIWDNVNQIFVFIDINDEFQRATGFILIQSFLNKAFKVPLQAYSTFLIQKKYKMNNKTLQLFIYDLFVEGLLMIIIFPPILFGYLRIVQYGGEYFYIFLQFFVFAVTILLVWIHPNLIAPLFNEFKQLQNVPVKNNIKILCQKIRFPLKKIFWMNGSVRSAHSNAYFYGFWKLKVVVLYDTLLSKLNPRQIASVICHELGHWKNNHSFKMLIVYLIQVLSLFYVFSLFLKVNEVSLSFGFNKKSTFIQTALFFNLLKPLTEVFDSLRHILTRKFQFQADQFACQHGYGPEIKNSLIKLFKQNTNDIKPDKLYAWFKHSHPTLCQRIQNIDLCIQKRLNLEQEWFQKQE